MSGPTTTAAAGAIVRDGLIASPLLGRLVVEWDDVFQNEVLEKWLDPCWRARAGSGEAVTSAGLVRAGVTEEVPFKLGAFFWSVQLLAWARANRCPWEASVCSLAAR